MKVLVLGSVAGTLHGGAALGGVVGGVVVHGGGEGQHGC